MRIRHTALYINMSMIDCDWGNNIDVLVISLDVDKQTKTRQMIMMECAVRFFSIF